MTEYQKSPGYIYAGLESSIDSLKMYNDASTYYEYPLIEYSSYGDFFEIANGSIVCKKPCIAEIYISVYLYTGFAAKDVVGVRLFNTVSQKTPIQANATARVANPYESNRCGPVVYQLNAGDVLTFQARNTNGSRGKIINYAHSTFVVIKTLLELE